MVKEQDLEKKTNEYLEEFGQKKGKPQERKTGCRIKESRPLSFFHHVNDFKTRTSYPTADAGAQQKGWLNAGEEPWEKKENPRIPPLEPAKKGYTALGGLWQDQVEKNIFTGPGKSRRYGAPLMGKKTTSTKGSRRGDKRPSSIQGKSSGLLNGRLEKGTEPQRKRQ